MRKEGSLLKTVAFKANLTPSRTLSNLLSSQISGVGHLITPGEMGNSPLHLGDSGNCPISPSNTAQVKPEARDKKLFRM